MNTLYKLTIACLLLLTSIGALGNQKANDVDRQKSRNIGIQEITKDVIDIYFARSVKIIFPWVLDDPTDELPLVVEMSGNVFLQHYQAGQNFITLSYVGPCIDCDGEVSDLFINSNGYHFSFTVRATADKKKHFSTIVAKLSGAHQLELLDREKKKLRAAFEKEYEERFKTVHLKAQDLALRMVGELAISEPRYNRVKEEEEIENGTDAAVIYVEHVVNYGSFYVVKFEIENRSVATPLTIDSVDAWKIEGGNNLPFQFEKHIRGRIQPNKVELGYIVTKDPIWKKDGDAVIKLATNFGPLEVRF